MWKVFRMCNKYHFSLITQTLTKDLITENIHTQNGASLLQLDSCHCQVTVKVITENLLTYSSFRKSLPHTLLYIFLNAPPISEKNGCLMTSNASCSRSWPWVFRVSGFWGWEIKKHSWIFERLWFSSYSSELLTDIGLSWPHMPSYCGGTIHAIPYHACPCNQKNFSVDLEKNFIKSYPWFELLCANISQTLLTF
jgi:hypothetical protein